MREPNIPRDDDRDLRRADAASQNRLPSLAFDVGRSTSSSAPFSRRRLLLQDLHVAGGLLGDALRAVHPPRRRPRPRQRRRRIPITTKRLNAFCDVLVVGSRPRRADGGAGRRRAPARASSCPRRISASAGGYWSERDDRRHAGRRLGGATVEAELESLAECPPAAAHHGLGLSMTATRYAALERVTDHMAAPPARAAPALLDASCAKRAVLATGAFERPLVFPRQRPAGRDAGRRRARAMLNEYGVAAGRQRS